jgi:hypothetical protein
LRRSAPLKPWKGPHELRLDASGNHVEALGMLGMINSLQPASLQLRNQFHHAWQYELRGF